MVTHHVDISWNEKFTGGEQKRHFKLDGNRLTLSTPQSPDPIDGKMSVRRLAWENAHDLERPADVVAAGRGAIAIAAATSMIAAPVISRQVSGSA